MSTITSRHELRKVNTVGGKNTESFTLVIPKYICEHLGIGKGDYLDIRMEGNKIVLKKLKEQAS